MIKIIGMVIFAALFAAAGDSHAVKLDGLFLTMKRLGGSYSPTYYWFRPDGRVLGTAPSGGLTAADFQASCQSQPAYCGTFKQSGEQVSITINGATSTVKINAAEGGYQVDGLATVKAEPMPSAKLNGTYSGSGPRALVSTGSGASVSSAHTYTFKADGTFNRESVGAVRTPDASKTAVGTAGGRYKISGNTLELTENGQTTRHLAFIPYSGAIVIDGIICRERR